VLVTDTLVGTTAAASSAPIVATLLVVAKWFAWRRLTLELLIAGVIFWALAALATTGVVATLPILAARSTPFGLLLGRGLRCGPLRRRFT
jgi:hypothetical protein